MDEVEELVLCEIMNQSLMDNTSTVSDADLAAMFGISTAAAQTAIERLIADDYLIRLSKHRYTVKFGRLDERNELIP